MSSYGQDVAGMKFGVKSGVSIGQLTPQLYKLCNAMVLVGGNEQS